MTSPLADELTPDTSHNLASILTDRHDSDNAVIHWAAGTITYRQLAHQVGATRVLLRNLGVSSGDRVALGLPNVPHMAVLYYAILAEGGIVVPLNPLLSEPELEYHCQTSGAQVLFTWEGTRVATSAAALGDDVRVIELNATYPLPDGPEAPEPIEAVMPSDPAVILFTSGTTGHPKGATLTHKNLMSNALTTHLIFDFDENDVFFGGLPLFHAFGQTVCLNTVVAKGASVALIAAFTPDGAIKSIIDNKVTVLVGVPTMYAALVAYNRLRPHPEIADNIRFGISGGSPLAPSTHAQVDEAFGFKIYEGYGLSETSPIVCFNQAKYGLVVGSVGRAIPGVDLQVRDEDGKVLGVNEPGELWVHGENVMAGFWNNPEATEAVFDGAWFRTGDVARIDEEGFVYIVDRTKDMILRNGYSIYPREIEDVIYQHPDVHLAAVVGEAKELVGEEVIAYIVPKDVEADNKHLGKEVRALIKENLASYKLPRHYKIVDSLPLGPTGKILKRML